ncbi:phage capsid family protein [Desulfosporosinus acidiphilus SJ4]|uniref:Phage capsid family protein n=1 Tax=Desulfosporosinus acidiphilus (strain DSM 22704 / JCM 16185 / SJ4) TaxID=646529 RepID=I4D5C0_DESAJ|nr:DUF5309 domain-containing protein [Desulfosporosinus acidiphilus]AFM40994.1 phage capsid family protein [Desulfosporosinus acidiphilus SJ4]
MITTANFTSLENINLAKEISLVSPLDTPFSTMLLGGGKFDTTTSKIDTWRTKSLDNTADISQVEGSETSVFQASARAEMSNVCEIFKKAVSVSGTASASGITGVPNSFAEEINDRLIEMKVSMEKQLINGVKNDGSATPFIRRMGGLFSFALAEQSISNATAGTLAEADVKDTVKALWTAGMATGQYIGMVNADLKERIDALYDGKYSYIAQENLFGLVVSSIATNYGTIKLLLNRHMPVDKMVVFDPAYLKIAYLRQPQFEMLAKTGDYTQGQVIAELTLKVMNPKAISVLTFA